MDGVKMELFSNNEILLMMGVVGVLLFSILVLALFDYLDRRKQKKKKVAVVDDSVEFGEKMEEVQVEEKKNDEMVEVLELDDEVMISDIATLEDEAEIVPIKKEEKQLLIEEEHADLNEEINKALETVSKEDAIADYEMEQERTAIISLDELMEKSNELYNDNEVTQYDDGNEPISIDEVIKMFNHDHEEVKTVVEKTKEIPEVYEKAVEEKIPYSKKETIPFISSVYGIEKDDNALEFENTATYEKLDRENYNDFVAQLKEMNENK